MGMKMKSVATFATLLAICIPLAAHTAETLPTDVRHFIEKRDICDHLRGEWPDPPDPARINEINAGIAKYCKGTDKRLAALRKRYARNKVVVQSLSEYESHLEGKAPTKRPR